MSNSCLSFGIIKARQEMAQEKKERIEKKNENETKRQRVQRVNDNNRYEKRVTKSIQAS